MNKKIKSKLGKLLLILGVAATVGSGIRFGSQKNEPPKVVKVESNLRTQERQERTYDTSFELNKNDRESSKKSINIGIDNDYVLKYRTKTDPGQVLEERQACFKQLIEELEAKKNAYEKVLSDDEIESLTSNTEQIILAKEVPNSGELGKFGPGSKGKGRARQNAPSSIGKGTSIFTHAYRPIGQIDLHIDIVQPLKQKVQLLKMHLKRNNVN